MSASLEQQAQAAAGAVLAIGECIQRLGSVPSGHLYAGLMGHMSLETYDIILGLLVEAGKIKHHPNHLLEWIG